MTDHNNAAAHSPRQIPAWISSVGNGWTTLLTQLHQDLTVLDADYQVDSFTAQFAIRLRTRGPRPTTPSWSL